MCIYIIIYHVVFSVLKNFKPYPYFRSHIHSHIKVTWIIFDQAAIAGNVITGLRDPLWLSIADSNRRFSSE